MRVRAGAEADVLLAGAGRDAGAARVQRRPLLDVRALLERVAVRRESALFVAHSRTTVAAAAAAHESDALRAAVGARLRAGQLRLLH